MRSTESITLAFVALVALAGCQRKAVPEDRASGDPSAAADAQLPADEAGNGTDGIDGTDGNEGGAAGDTTTTEGGDTDGTAEDAELRPDLLAQLLRDDPELRGFASRAETLRLQILLTPLDGIGDPRPPTFRYRVGEEYVFTASAIKTFVSVFALQKLATIPGVDAETPVGFCEHEPGKALEAACPDVPTPDDTHVATGLATLGHELRKMHLVSNNGAFNRLYDFVGQDEIHARAKHLGFESLRLRHRMGQAHTLGTETPPMVFFPSGSKPVRMGGARSEQKHPPTKLAKIEVGVAHIGRGRERVEEARDFSMKNHVELDDLHRMTLSIVRPELEASSDLGLRPVDRARLLDAMTVDPLDSNDPKFEGKRFSGRRYKLMWRGVERVVPAASIRYVNKAGRAYGFHVETAYVEDTRSGRAFVLTAVVYANENGVVGDDEYEYEQVTRPFFRRLGEVLAQRLLVEP